MCVFGQPFVDSVDWVSTAHLGIPSGMTLVDPLAMPASTWTQPGLYVHSQTMFGDLNGDGVKEIVAPWGVGGWPAACSSTRSSR